MSSEDANHRLVAEWLHDADSAVAFTGAGISTESGIPDFRSPAGVWSRNQPVYFDEFLASADARYEYWRQKSEAHDDMMAAAPNGGHQVLARWEQSVRLRGVITQNIDGLHQQAGSRRVLELHGTARRVVCLDCQETDDVEPYMRRFRKEDAVPLCPHCSGRLKAATISFGQPLSPEVMEEASAWSRAAPLFLAIGSSLVVSPARDLPRLASSQGARLVIINGEPTDQDDAADVVLHARIGETLAGIDACLGELASR